MKKKLVLGTLIVTSLVQYSAPAHANKETIGNIIGGIIGGAIGSNVGKGNGNTAAIIVGAIAGTMIGGKVGRDMDEADRQALAEAQRRCLNERLGDRYDWDGGRYGSRTGARGSFTTTREGYNNRTGEYCREYTSVIHLRGRVEETRGTACSRRDGSWYEVRETEVRFGSLGRQEPSRPPRYPDAPSRPNLPPPAPVQSSFEGTTQVSQITRRSGGEWVRIYLREAISLDRLEVRVLSAGMRIHEAVLHTDMGRMTVRELTHTPSLYAGDMVISEGLSYGGRVQAIDIRAESMGGYADILVKAISNSGYPSLSVSRF